MANNLENRDSYLIFGVNNAGNIISIENSNRRKNQNEIITFLKDKKFAGGVRPTTLLKTIHLNNHEIDVLIIKNTCLTPYYLIESFSDKKVKSRNPRICLANHIYTRVGDTNTDINKSADIDKVEYLWKKRFGIGSSIIERLNIVLDDWENWGIYVQQYNHGYSFIQGGDWGNYHYIFNKMNPEFRIVIDPKKHTEWQRETMRCFYINQTGGHYDAKVFYNSTELYAFSLAYVDEYRVFLVLPQTGYYKNDFRSLASGTRFDDSKNVNFYYLIKNSIEGKIQRIITHNTYNTGSRRVLDKYWLLLFEDEKEFADFITFAEENKQLYRPNLKSIEYALGDEELGAHFPIADNHNAYRVYVEYLIKCKGIDKTIFQEYFRLFSPMENKLVER